MKLFTRKPNPIPCQQVVELVTAYLEGALPAAEHRRLEAHLSACDACSSYLDQLRETIAIAGRLEPADLSPEAYDELGGVFSAWAAERP